MSETQNLLRLRQSIFTLKGEARVAGVGTPNIKDVITLIDKGEILHSYALLDKIFASKAFRREREYITPVWIADFYGKLAGIRKPTSVLDPVCGTGLMLQKVIHASNPELAIGVEKNSDIHHIASKFLKGKAEIKYGDFFAVENDISQSFDFIFADAPIGVRLSTTDESSPYPPNARDLAEAIAFWSTEHLNEDGLLAIVVPNKQVWDTRFHKQIWQAGCKLSGFIHIPGGSMLTTSMPVNIMLLEHGEQEQIFTAKWTEDNDQQDIILSNFQEKTNGHHPSLGIWCDLDGFRGYESYEAQYRLEQIARDTFYNPVQSENVFSEVPTRIREDDRTFVFTPSDFLIDMRGDTYSHFDELSERRRRHVTLVQLNQANVDPAYFKYWLQSKIGKLSFKAYSSSALVNTVSTRALREATYYLPDLNTQKSLVNSMQMLDAVKNQIDETLSLCWDGQDNIQEIVERTEQLCNVDTYDEWIETLPFPLASILWRHHTADDSARIRVPIISHFFEAHSAFMATIYLSAFISNENEWTTTQPLLLDNFKKANHTFERMTFGSWNSVCHTLSKRARTLLNDKNTKEFAKDLLHVHDDNLIEVLLSKQLIRILDEANTLRNTHLGHGGADSEHESIEVERQFVDLVGQFRKLFGYKWKQFELLMPNTGAFRQGHFHYQLPSLTGTRSQFRRVERRTVTPMEEGELHLLGKGESRGLRLLPFVQMKSSPHDVQDACYFFNRSNRDGCRFISYHYEHSELNEEFLRTQNVIQQITTLSSDAFGDISE